MFQSDCLSNRNTDTPFWSVENTHSKHCLCHDTGEIPHTFLSSVWLNFHREVSLTLFRFFSGFPLEYLDPSYRLCCNLPWVVTPKIELNTKQTVVKTEHFTAVFLYPFLGRTWLNGKQKPHQSGVILSQRWWAVHSHYQLQSIRHEKHVSLFTQGMYLSRQG